MTYLTITCLFIILRSSKSNLSIFFLKKHILKNMKKSRFNFEFSTKLDLILIACVAVIVLIFWLESVKDPLKAPPITTGPNANTNTLEALSFQAGDGNPGGTGYQKATLGEACSVISSGKSDPNIPFLFKLQECNEQEDLICLTDFLIAEGQEYGYCLKKPGGDCKQNSDCTPDYFCISNICQRQYDTINNPCQTDLDCQNGVEQLNHVCDPTSKRCKYNIYPKDSGCINDDQCFTPPDSEVKCLNKVEEFSISYSPVTYTSSSDSFIYDKTDSVIEAGDNVKLTSEESGYLGVFLVTDVSVIGTSTRFNLFQTNVSESDTFTIGIGGKRDGICVVKYPTGTIPSKISGTKENYPCEEKTIVAKSGTCFCVENDRTQVLGTRGQICNTYGLGCISGLTCLYLITFMLVL